MLPFIGPGAAVALIAIAAFLQFGTLAMAGVGGGAALIIAATEGNVLTPMLIGRAGELNTVAVFVSVMVWGWLWDVWGCCSRSPSRWESRQQPTTSSACSPSVSCSDVDSDYEFAGRTVTNTSFP